MTNRLDAQQLDQVWDASVLGQPLPLPVQDAEELRLLELLAEVNRPAPDPAFFRELERELALAVPVEAIAAPSARLPEPIARTLSDAAHLKHRAPVRTSIPAYAVAVVALLLTLSTVVISLPRFDSENERSISAVSGWEEDNSHTFGGEGGSSQSILSPSAAVETLFSQTLDQAELERYQSGDWSWIGITRGTIEPGEESVFVPGSPVAYDPEYAGIGAIFVEQGALAASVDAGAWILRGNGESTTRIDARTTVTLDAGDTLFLPPSALPALWNSGESDANYLAGGVYTTGSAYPLDEFYTRSLHGGITVDPNDLAIGIPLTMSSERVSIEPGASYSYPISSETWLMAMVIGDGLEKQRQIEGVTNGDAQALVPSVYSLHQDGFGTYTLTNSGSETVDIYFYRVEPLSEPMPEATPNAQSSALLDSTLSPELLQGYRFDDWRWIQFNRNAVFPQGDSTAFAQLMLAGWNVVPGLNLIAIESGVLIVEPDSEVLVARGVSGAFERQPGGSEITLAAGDSLLYSSGTEGRFWNPTDVDTVVVGGGGYLRPESPTFGATNAVRFFAGQFGHGLTVDSADMPDDVSLSISIERVSISPGGNATYDLGGETWVIVTVERGDLTQTTYLQGEQVGEMELLRQGEVRLNPEAGKSVELRNVGSGMAVLYVMTFEPDGSDDIT